MALRKKGPPGTMALFNDPTMLGGTLMHHQMNTLLKGLRQDVAQCLDPESIDAACRAVGHTWRNCTLIPSTILHWFVIQISHGNTSLELSHASEGASSPARPTAWHALVCHWPFSKSCFET